MSRAVDVEVLRAWLIVLERVHPRERTLIGLAAMADVGNSACVHCTSCTDLPAAMSISAAVAHLRDSPRPVHDLAPAG